MVMKGKNLERAVILGLILSTGVYGSALAEDYNADNIQQNGIVVGTGETIDYTLNGNVEHRDMDKTWIINNAGKLTITGNDNNSITVKSNGTYQDYGQAGIVLENGSHLNINNLKNLTLTVGENSQGNKTTYGLFLYNGNAEINLKEDFY